MAFVRKWALLAAFLVLVSLLLIGGPGHYSSRIYGGVWNIGHLALFIIFSLLLYRLPFIKRKKPYEKIITVFIAAVLFAAFTELLQFATRGTPEFIDIRRDMVGTFIGTLLAFKSSYRGSKKLVAATVVVAALTINELVPLTRILVDEYDVQRSGVVLSNLEGMFEDERWKGNSTYVLSSDFVIEGKRSLKVTFNTDEYSGITLKYMHRDWSANKNMHISIFKQDGDDLMLNVRINDFFHIENNRENDRYNKKIIVNNGWNHFEFSIDDIENAPIDRAANIQNMQSFGMYVTNLSEPTTIYIDNVYLE